MTAGAGTREGSRHTDDISVVILELLSQVDFVAGRVFVEDFKVGDFVADLDEGARGGVEGLRERLAEKRSRAAERGAEEGHFGGSKGFQGFN